MSRAVPLILIVCSLAAGCNGSDEPARKAGPGPAGEVVARIPVPAEPAHLHYGFGSLWVTTYDDNRLYRIDPASERVVATVRTGTPQGTRWLGVGAGAVWVSDFDANKVWRVDPRTNRVTAVISVGLNPTGVGFSPGAVWVTNHRAGAIQRIDPRTNRVTKTIRLGPDGPGGPQTIGYGGGDLWVTIPNLARTARVDPETGRVERTFELAGCGPTYAIGEVVWLAAICEGDTIVRLSAPTNKILREGKLPPYRWYALTPDAFWLSTNPNRLVLLRADARTLRVVGRLDLGVASRGNRIAVGAESVWVGGADIVIRVKPHR